MTAQRFAATDHSVMRALNRRLVLDHVRATSPTTRTSIAQATGLARPTVSLIVDALLAEGVVRESGRGETGAVGGRPPALLSFEPRSECVVALDVGSRSTTAVVADGLGTELHRLTGPTPAGSAARSLRGVAALGRRAMRAAGVQAERLGGVGVCLPGLVSHDGGVVRAPDLGWYDVPAADLLAEQLGAPVQASNAAQAALVAEVAHGAAVGELDVLLVHVGAGVHAAAMSAGRVVAGASGLAGELGHCRILWAGGVCSCGRQGCLETMASESAVGELLAQRRGVPEPVAAPAVVAAALAGDDDAVAVLRWAGSALGWASSWLANVYDPGLVVLSGSLATAGSPLVEAFEQALRHDALPAIAERLQVVTGSLGERAALVGGVAMALDAARSGPRVVAG